MTDDDGDQITRLRAGDVLYSPALFTRSSSTVTRRQSVPQHRTSATPTTSTLARDRRHRR